jgi:hypothetical protein
MTIFTRTFPTERLSKAVEENKWFSDLLLNWRPAGDVAGDRLGKGGALVAPDPGTEGAPEDLRVAFRNGYMNFYRAGQSVARVRFDKAGKLQAKIHSKYVYGSNTSGQDYVTLTAAGFPELGTGRLVPYQGLHEWISNANRHIGDEKRFVDLVVAHNPDVIDLEMGLPAYSKIPGENRAPRMDLVAIEPAGDCWQVVFWEAKLVGDGRARCKDNDKPKVVGQLDAYTEWLNHADHRELVAWAYQNTCRMLVDLHTVASRLRPNIEELGLGIRAVAAKGAPPLLIDDKPRLLIDNLSNDVAFKENGHLDKLRNAPYNLQVQIVETQSEWALCTHI